MPQFYFHVHDGHDCLDKAGTALPNLQAAGKEAIRGAGEMIRDFGDRFPKEIVWRMEVANEAGEPVLTLRFSAVAH